MRIPADVLVHVFSRGYALAQWERRNPAGVLMEVGALMVDRGMDPWLWELGERVCAAEALAAGYREALEEIADGDDITEFARIARHALAGNSSSTKEAG